VAGQDITDELTWSGEAKGIALAIVGASLSIATFRCTHGKGELWRAYPTYQGRLYCVLTYHINGRMMRGRIVALMTPLPMP